MPLRQRATLVERVAELGSAVARGAVQLQTHRNAPLHSVAYRDLCALAATLSPLNALRSGCYNIPKQLLSPQNM